MKRIVSLVLVLCVLAVSAAFAAERKVGVDLYAREGLDFTLMENRFALTDEAAYKRMQWAYETIHASEHFADMPAAVHADGIGTDINRELAEMNLNLTAYDYFIYDSFDLRLQKGYADQIANGNTIELRFDLNLDRSVHPVVLLSNDQISWKCLDHSRVQLQGDGSLCVRFDEMGTVLVLIEVEHKLPGSDDYGGSFTPSVSGKAAPDVIAPDANDPDTIALIYNELDELISRVPDNGYLVITPVSRRDAAEDMQVRQRLDWAYNQIRTTPRIGNLPGAGNTLIADAVDRVLEASGFDDLTSDDMIVRDLFDASLYGTEYVTAIRDEGHYIEIIFDLKLSANDPLVILVTNDNSTWQVLDWNDYDINADGTVTVRLEQLGAIAILVDSQQQGDSGVKSPKTGE